MPIQNMNILFNKWYETQRLLSSLDLTLELALKTQN